MKRRRFVQGVATASVLVAAGSVWRARERGVFAGGDGPAYEPWKNWRSDQPGGALALVRAAILAANPHNTQPWLFRLSPSRIDVFANRSRNIGSIDPHLREMYVGVGCALENLTLAAGANGFSAEVALAPSPLDPSHAARIELTPQPPHASDLYNAIPLRHTNRGPYRTGIAVTAATRSALAALSDSDPELRVLWFTEASDRTKFGTHVIEATEAIIADEGQARDSAKWYRLQWDELQRYRDGITVDAMGASALMSAGAKWLPPLSRAQNDAFWLRATRDVHVLTAAAFGIMAVRDADNLSQRLRCGRLWQRMLLYATTLGLALHPLNQMPERALREQLLKLEPRSGNALRELQGGDDWQALMTFRAGYPEHTALASPRRAVEAVLI